MTDPVPQYLTVEYKIGLCHGKVIISGWSDSDADEISRKTKAKVEEQEKKILFGIEYYEVVERSERKLPDDEI